MLGLGGLGFLPPTQTADVQIFRFSGAVADMLQTWCKPRGVSYVNFVLIGAGGGGGGGATGAAGTSRSGGGGGGSGTLVACIVPAIFVPDSLGVRVGAGGAGGATGGGSGGTGTQTSLIYSHSQLTQQAIVAAQGAGATGATSGGVTTAAGANGSISRAGVYTSLAGNAGVNGTTSTPAAPLWSFPCGGGAGGGGVSTSTPAAGGDAAANGAGHIEIYPWPRGGAVSGGNGQDGWFNLAPLFSYGGAGGAGSNAGAGGNGGGAGVGGGGGGGGAGATGGTGGRGGDGLCIIISG